MPPTPQYVSYTKCTAFELSDFGEKEIAFNHISVVLVHYNLEFSCIVWFNLIWFLNSKNGLVIFFDKQAFMHIRTSADEKTFFCIV